MKTKLLLMMFFTLGVGNIFAQSKKDVLTNQKIIQLSDMGLPSSTIVSKIKNSQTNFDVSTDALIELKKAGVSGDVLSEMITAESKSSNEASNQKDMNDPNTMHKTGIYYYNPNKPSNPMKRVDPSVVSSSSSGSTGDAIAQHFSYGLASTTSKSSLSGAQSTMQITETNPTFYFYFKVDENQNADSWFFANATSPKEFVLIWLFKKKDKREMKTGSGNFYSSSSGIPEKDKLPFEYTEVSEGIYKVTFSKPLKQGEEFCFLYASAAPERWSSGGNKVFDFGVSGGQ